MWNGNSPDYFEWQLTGFRRFVYRGKKRWRALGDRVRSARRAIPRVIGRGWRNLLQIFSSLFTTFRQGDVTTRASYFIMGAGQLLRGQYLRGFAYLACELSFLAYMAFFGWQYLLSLRKALSFK